MSTTAINIHGATGPNTNKDSRSFCPHSLDEIHVLENYHPLEIKLCRDRTCPIGLGNSFKDIIIIVACYIILYAFLTGFFALLFTVTLTVSSRNINGSSIVLWSYLFIAVLFVISIAINVYFTQLEIDHKRANEALEEEKRLKEVLFTVPVTPADNYNV